MVIMKNKTRFPVNTITYVPVTRHYIPTSLILVMQFALLLGYRQKFIILCNQVNEYMIWYDSHVHRLENYYLSFEGCSLLLVSTSSSTLAIFVLLRDFCWYCIVFMWGVHIRWRFLILLVLGVVTSSNLMLAM